jgi:hypothetical protein
MSDYKFESEYSRICPQCNELIFHKNQRALNQSLRTGNKPCRSCVAKNLYEKHVQDGTWKLSNKGLTIKREKPKFWKLCPTDGCNELTGYTTLYKLKQNPTTTCKKCTRNMDAVNDKIRIAIQNESVETKRKRRTSAIKRLQRSIIDGKMLQPNYNVSSITILEAKATELGITDLMHAENGGEFHIKELGYWVDGYSPAKNIVFEFDEKGHFDKNGLLKNRDQIRQKEIEEYLKCSFIRIRE